MEKHFGAANWREHIPHPLWEEHPEYTEFYEKTWEMAYNHIKSIPGMPQNPYMDEAFCATQVWIWDTCFMALFCKFARDIFPGVETLNNFYQVLHHQGHLPTIMTPEDEPFWTRAIPGEPYEIKVHIADNPPLFAWAEYENALMSGDLAYIKELLYERGDLQRHYDYLENLVTETTPRGVLCTTHWTSEKEGYRWEGGSSGMDNTPRGRIGVHAGKDRPNNPNMLWLDAICQQALSARIIAKLYDLAEDNENSTLWKEKYLQKKNIVNRLYWCEEDGFYYDIDRNSHDFFKVKTIASYWTLLAGIASEEQADRLIKELFNPETLGGFVPLVSLARNDVDYHADGQYWRGSVWLPTAYMTLKGISQYGHHKEAHDLAQKLLHHMYRTYTDYTPHTVWECYNPEFYKPGAQVDSVTLCRPDFCGWSALGPIAIYLEFVLGFHTIDAFRQRIEWEKPTDIQGKIGIENLSFGDITTSIEYDGSVCLVTSTAPYTLVISGREYAIKSGKQTLQ